MREFDVLKVAALKLFHPTVSSVLFRTDFGNYDTTSQGERGRSVRLETEVRGNDGIRRFVEWN